MISLKNSLLILVVIASIVACDKDELIVTGPATSSNHLCGDVNLDINVDSLLNATVFFPEYEVCSCDTVTFDLVNIPSDLTLDIILVFDSTATNPFSVTNSVTIHNPYEGIGIIPQFISTSGNPSSVGFFLTEGSDCP